MATTNNDDIKKLLESFDRTEQWRSNDAGTPNGKLVGETEKFLGDPYIREEEFNSLGVDRNKEMAYANIDLIKGQEGEQRRVWQQHYDRAIRNGRDKMRARQYADSMTRSESAFGEGEEIQVDERELGAGLGNATHRGTPPWMMPGGGNDDDNFGGKKTSFELAGNDDDIDVNPFDDVDEAADTFNPEKDADTGMHVRMAKQPTSVFQKPGLSAAARKMAADRELKKMKSNNPFDPDDLDFTAPAAKPQKPVFNSKDYSDVSVLEAKLMKAYEDYVGDPYSENNVIPKAAKKPGKDTPKPKKAKRAPEANELNEIFADQGSGSSDAENKEWKKKHDAFMKKKKQIFTITYAPSDENAPHETVNVAATSAEAAKAYIAKRGRVISVKKKEKPFRDAAVTGNPRDFANEAKGPSKEQAKKNDAEWSKIVAHWKKLHGNDAQMPSGAAGEQRMRQAWNKANKKKVTEAPKGKSENRELWDRINSRGTTRGFDKERYTDMSGEGLEGPFSMKNGKVLYYDPKEGNYYDRDTDMYVSYDDYQAMNEGDPDIPYEMHLRNKEKDRKAFVANFQRGEGDRLRKATDASIAQFMKQANNFTKPNAAVGESSRGAKLASLRAKFEDASNKLKELKGQKALKEAPIDQTVAQPINTAQSPAQQAPVQAPAGTPTAVPAQGQPTPPAAGQPGGAPVQAPGTPAPPGQGATNAATTPAEQMKGFVQTLSSNPAGAKQLATKLNTVR